MLEAIRVRRDSSSQKIRNTTLMNFVEGQRVRVYDIKSKKYSELGSVVSCYLSGDGVIRTYGMQLDSNINRWVNFNWIRPHIQVV